MPRPKRDLPTHPPPLDAEVRTYRKSNQEIGFRIKTGQLSFLSRKLFNVLVYYTQHSSEGEDGRWWIPMGDVVRDAAVNSHDYTAIKEYLSELQDVRVVRDTPGEYLSEVLVSSVKIVNSVPGAKRGGRVMLGWAFPPDVKKQLLDPDIYTRLSLYYQTMLRTIGGLTLYEVCKRYATNPSGVTNKAPWRWWWEYMTGSHIGSLPPAYKYFKRDVLSPAIKEVNAVTDLEIELIESKEKRFVTDLQFAVRRKAQQSLDLPAPPVIDTDIARRIQQFGITKEEAERLSVTVEEVFLRETIAFVEKRRVATNSPSIDNLAAYFKAALKGRYAEKGAPPLPALENKTKPKSIPSSPKEAENTQRAAIRQAFADKSEDEQQRLINIFLDGLDSSVVSDLFRKSGLKTKRNEVMFLDWLASRNDL